MILEEFRDRLGVGGVLLDAQRQGLDAAQLQEAILRPGHPAGGVLHEFQRFKERLVVDDQRPAQHIAVPADVLGGRVQHDVCAKFERPLKHWRGKGVVHQHGDGPAIGA